MDYVLNVETEAKVPVTVIMRWGEETCIFRKKGKSLTADGNKSIAPNEQIAIEMRKQAFAILFGSKSKKKKKSISIPTRNMLPETRARVEKLKLFRAEITVDGRIMIVEKKGRTYFFPSIDKAKSGHKKAIDARLVELVDLKVAQDIVLRSFRSLTYEAKYGEEFQIEALKTVYDKLKRCDNNFKKQAAEELNAFFLIFDKHGLVGKDELANSLKFVCDLLRQRIEILPVVIQFLEKRLEVFIEEEINMLKQINKAFTKLKTMIKSSNVYFRNKSAIDSDLDSVIVMLKSVWLEPYYSETKLSIKHITKAKRFSSANKKRDTFEHVRGLLGIILDAKKGEM